MPSSLILILFLGAAVLAAIAVGTSGSSTQEERVDWNSRGSVEAEWKRASAFHAHCLRLHTEEDKQELIARVARGEVIEPLSMRGDHYWHNLTPSDVKEAARTHHHHFLQRYRALGGRA